MSLRKKTLIITASIMAVLTVVMILSFSLIWFKSFGTVERKNINDNISRVVRAIDNELLAMDIRVADYADWDQTYKFIENHNPQYIRANLAEGTLSDLLLNFIVFIDSSGGVVFSSGYDLIEGKAGELPADILDHLGTEDILLTRGAPEVESISGVLLLAGEPLLVVSRPIRTTSGEGPVRGSIIAGRYFDTEEIGHIAAVTDLSVDVHGFNAGDLPADFAKAKASFTQSDGNYIGKVEGDSVGGYSLLRDIYGQPALIARVDVPKGSVSAGKLNVLYFGVIAIIIGVISILMVLYFLDKTVLSPLSLLSNVVSMFSLSDELSPTEQTTRIPVGGLDDLSVLGGNINEILDDVEHAKIEKTETSEKYNALLQSSVDSIIISDLEGQILDVSQSALLEFGFERDEMLGYTVGILTSEEQAETFLGFYDKVSEEEPVHFEVDLIKQGGEYFTAEVSLQMIGLDEGGFIQTLVRDVSKRIEAEEEINNLEKFVSDNVNPIIRVSKDGTIVYSNHAAATLLSNWKSALGEPLPAELLSVLKEVISLGVTEEVEIENEETPFSLSFVSVSDGTYVNIFGRDISEIKELEKEVVYYKSLEAATLEANVDGIIAVDKQGGIVGYNQKFAEMWGIPIEVLERKDDKALLQNVIDKVQDPEAYVQQIMYTYNNPMEESIGRVELKDGSVFERTSKPQLVGGKVVGRVWNFRDITEMLEFAEKAEEKEEIEEIEDIGIIVEESEGESNVQLGYQLIIDDVTKAVNEVSNIEEVMKHTVSSLYDNMENVTQAGIYIIDGMKAVLKAQMGYSEEDVLSVGSIEYPRGVTWKAILEGKSHYVENLESDPIIGPLAKKLSLRGYFSAPIEIDGEAVGALDLGSTAINAFDENDKKLVEHVVRLLETAIRNSKKEAELLESKERFLNLANAAPLMIWMSDSDKMYNYFNRSWLDFAGRNLEEEIETGWTKRIHSDDSEPFLNHSLKAYNSREEFSMEFRLKRHDGNYRWVSFNAAPRILDDGSLAGYVGTCVDISDLKNVDIAYTEREKKIEKQNNVLVELSKFRTLESGDPKSALQKITEAVTNTVDVERASVWLFKDDNSKLSCLDLYEMTQLKHSAGVELAILVYPTYFRSLAERDVIVASDAHNDASLMEFAKNYLSSLGISSVIVVPVRLSGKVVGALSLEHVGKERDWTIEEAGFAISVSEIVALYLEQWRGRWAEEEMVKSRVKTEGSLRYLNAVMNNMADGIITTNSGGKILRINPAFSGMFGLGEASCVGRDSKEVLGKELLKLIEASSKNRDKVITAEIPLSDDRVGMAMARVVQGGNGDSAADFGTVVTIRYKT